MMNPDEANDRLDRDRIRKMFEDIKEPPGPPFFDATMNFLDSHYKRTRAEIGKMTDRKLKLEGQIAQKDEELMTTYDLLLKEYREKHIVNPETGEVIDEPHYD